MRTLLSAVRDKSWQWIESSALGFRLSLIGRYRATGPHGLPDAPWHNAVLKNQNEVDSAIGQVRKLGLPVMMEPSKNWDSLAALDLILKSTEKDAQVFDAGGELYSMILPWLYLYGYRNLSAGNLVFKKSIRKAAIRYQYSDITQTEFEPESLDAITCLSVIEHGVSLRSYFAEMFRILKPGGILITSTDYFETEVDTMGQMAFGVPIHIFTRDEIAEALQIASECGFTPTGPLDLSSDERVVHWNRLDYTFIVFSLEKTSNV
jgi:SAM-dependent methyltransferase